MKSETSIANPKKPSASSNLIYKLSIGTLIAAALLIILGLVSFVQNNEQQAALDEQSRRTSDLVQRVKDLSEQNKKLSQTAVNYAYCNSVILARYTQSQDPITVEDLNGCVISSFPEGEGAPTIDEIRANVSGNNTPSAQTTQNSQPKEQDQSPSPEPPVSPPSNPNPPQVPRPPQEPTPNRPSNNLLTLYPSPLLPGIQLNTPCLQVANLLGTCRAF